MKKLILLRHAKASKEPSFQDDFERPLIERGISDIKKIATSVGAVALPDTILCSPAKRTKSTAELFCKQLHLPETLIQYEFELYLAGVNEMIHLIRNVSDDKDCVLLVGHNPGITGMVGAIGNEFIEHIPTSGAVILNLTVPSWKLLSANSCQITHRFFDR
jgi:phosphohistidine phosphatase